MCLWVTWCFSLVSKWNVPLKKTKQIFLQREKTFVRLGEKSRGKMLMQKCKCCMKVQCENHLFTNGNSHVAIHAHLCVKRCYEYIDDYCPVMHMHRSIHTSQLMQREILFYAFTCSENILVETHTSLYVYSVTVRLAAISSAINSSYTKLAQFLLASWRWQFLPLCVDDWGQSWGVGGCCCSEMLYIYKCNMLWFCNTTHPGPQLVQLDSFFLSTN